MKRTPFAAKPYDFKRVAPGTRRSSLKAGRKVKQWAKVRAELKIQFEGMSITSCELRYEDCWIANGLGFAHGRKRRHLKGDELETLTILACNSCHDKIEYLGPEKMLAIVEDVIARRKLAA